MVIHGVLDILVPTRGMHSVSAGEPHPRLALRCVLETNCAVREVVLLGLLDRKA